MGAPDNVVMISPGVWVDPALLDIVRGQSPVAATGTSDVVLDEHHVMWHHASGGSRDRADRQWTMGDLAEAAITLDAISSKKAGVFFDLLLGQPGRLFTSEEIMAAAPDTFASPYAVAGSLNGFRKHVERAGRVYPFHWWEGDTHGTLTRYAVRPSVAAVFDAARQR
jgi:hypothetical protein